MNSPENREETIDWGGMGSDEEVIAKLTELVEEAGVSGSTMRQQSVQEVERAILLFIASKGFPNEVTLMISEPDSEGKRVIKGTTLSPVSGKDIDF